MTETTKTNKDPNIVEMIGSLEDIQNYGEKVSKIKLLVSEEYKGKEYKSIFFMPCFGDMITKVNNIPLNSIISIRGKLRNNSYDKDGGKVYQTQVIPYNITILKKSEGSPKPQLEDEVPF